MSSYLWFSISEIVELETIGPSSSLKQAPVVSLSHLATPWTVLPGSAAHMFPTKGTAPVSPLTSTAIIIIPPAMERRSTSAQRMMERAIHFQEMAVAAQA